MHRNPYMYCRDCGHCFWYGESFSYPAIEYGWLPSPQRLCQKCSERENMPNIKITAEVDGKQVPLNTISTESFEAIKALEKPKEIPIPVARLATNRSGAPRLLFKPKINIILDVGRLYALDLELGMCSNMWVPRNDRSEIAVYYENVKPL